MASPTASSSIIAVAATGTVSLDALINGNIWGAALGAGTTLSYSFPWSSGGAVFYGLNATADYSSVGEPTAALHYALSAEQQTATTAALKTWANVAKLTFQPVADTATSVGDLRFAWTSADGGAGAWGWTWEPTPPYASSGDVWISTKSTAATDTDWAVGSYNFEALIHEAGHALGLKHPFEGEVQLPASQDTRQYTLMAYADSPHSLFVRVTGNSREGWAWNSFTVSPDTPMVYDVAVVQYLYGANLSYRTGDDTYSFDPATPFFRTIWDAGGKDTISVANFARACTIDLNPGHYSKIAIASDTSPAGLNWTVPPPTATYDGTDNLGIAYGCNIENAVGGGGDDTLIGNSLANQLSGGAGNDSLSGGAGIDTATYAGARANFTITRTASGCTVSDKTGAEGRDALADVERLQFSLSKLALDLDGNAGTVAKTLGAVFGKAAVSDPQMVGIGLGLVDSGVGYADLMAAALNYAGAKTSVQVVNLLWTNVMGSSPGTADAAPYVEALDKGVFTAGALGVLAADLDANKINIGLTGLQQTGIEYTQ